MQQVSINLHTWEVMYLVHGTWPTFSGMQRDEAKLKSSGQPWPIAPKVHPGILVLIMIITLRPKPPKKKTVSQCDRLTPPSMAHTGSHSSPRGTTSGCAAFPGSSWELPADAPGGCVGCSGAGGTWPSPDGLRLPPPCNAVESSKPTTQSDWASRPRRADVKRQLQQERPR